MTGRFLLVNGQRLAVWEQTAMGTPILFVHATGFHARCWNQVIARLPSRHCYAVDMRGHGLSSKPAPPYSWKTLGEDVAELTRGLRLSGAIGVGHSMGGHSLVSAALAEPGAFSHLVLIDPVILPREFYGHRPRDSHFARKRKNRWLSSEEMFDRFHNRPPFRDWDTAVLRDYCHWGLTREGDDHVLACPPEIEASIYEAAAQQDANLHGELHRLTIPVTVVRATRTQMGPEGPAADMTASPTDPELASRFPKGRDVAVRYSHFIPMEAPALVAEMVRELGSDSGMASASSS